MRRIQLYVDGVQKGAGTPAPGATIDYGLQGNRFYIHDYPVDCPFSADFDGGIDELRVTGAR